MTDNSVLNFPSKASHVYRIHMYGPTLADIRNEADEHDLSGVAGYCSGFGILNNNTNPTIFIEVVHPTFDQVRAFICSLLVRSEEQYAHVTVDGKHPFLLYQNGGSKGL
jgi:hypothetical protein